MFKKRYYLYIFLSILVITTVVYVKKEFSVRIKIEKRKIPLTIKLTNHLGADSPASIINDILKEKYEVKISDKNYDMIFDSAYADIEGINRDYSIKEERDPKIIRMFYTPEAILPNLDNYDLTIGFDHVDDPRYIRVPWYYFQSYNSKIRTDYDKVADLGKCAPKKPHFACFLISNNNTEGNNWRNNMPFDGCVARENIFNKLSEYKKVLSGGKALNNIGKVIPGKETMSWLSQCKFVIAYENQTYDGYITEKPFQAYFAGSIPIYYGAKSAVADINKKAVIYAGDFNSDEELVDYIKKVDQDDSLYCDIWNQNIMTNPDGDFEVVKDKLRKKLFEVIDTKLPKK
jgi:hypothetical protein